MIHEALERRVAQWVADAPFVVSAVLAFLGRFVPAVRKDADRSLALGGRVRIIIDVEGDHVSVVKVRLLRSEFDQYRNRTLYAWHRRPSEAD